MIVLDWSKAFDSINPGVLIGAPRRFGLPKAVLDVVGSIHENRSFRAANETGKSQEKTSWNLARMLTFSISFRDHMTVVTEDAVAELSFAAGALHREGVLRSLLYADDTLLVGSQTEAL